MFLHLDSDEQVHKTSRKNTFSRNPHLFAETKSASSKETENNLKLNRADLRIPRLPP